MLLNLNHKLRQKIIELIDKEKKSSLTSLAKNMHMELNVLSQHIAILRNANIILHEKIDNKVYYYLNYEQIEAIFKYIDIAKILINPQK